MALPPRRTVRNTPAPSTAAGRSSAGPARRTPARGATPAARGEVIHTAITGDTESVMARLQKEHQKLDARREASSSMSKMPFRFWVEPGSSKEIVVVDEGISFARNEHACKNPRTNRFDLYLPCIAEVANCPVCAAHPDKTPYFAAFLTILDLTPYEDRNTGEEVPFSKRLLEIKPMQQKKFMRLQEKHGSLRGMVLTMTRDSKKDARIGNDIEYAGEVLSEEDLATYVRVYEDRSGKEQEVLGYEPFNYEEIFPDMSEEQLRAICDGAPDPGSRSFEDEALNDGGDGFDDDAPTTTRRPARAAAVPSRAAPTSRTPASRTPQRAHTRPARQEEAEEDVVEGEEEVAGERPPPRSSSLASQRAALRRR